MSVRTAYLSVVVAAALSVASSAAADAIDLETRLRGQLEAVLKDAHSAQLEILSGPTQRKYVYMGFESEGQVVCTRVNAKNSYGGYVGWRPYLFTLKPNGAIGVIYGGERHSDELIQQLCGA
ncbi:hypothetical protein [Phenylobacterium sp. 58.2.17]|uniref:hypothetical protein n=1 Tax=Phenylobacterium sp. 58.2.17 TaxID=2969306 RepID=UPI0022644D03|nr:hypothetical protein [Phenylobacterium sp. 58.2.17]MCX7586578.1 hypothetical protein [Phenylobacterium sp. 58.2.17]